MGQAREEAERGGRREAKLNDGGEITTSVSNSNRAI
jgi:hypothetical protein